MIQGYSPAVHSSHVTAANTSSLSNKLSDINNKFLLPSSWILKRERGHPRPTQGKERDHPRPTQGKKISFFFAYTWLLLGSPALLIAYLARCVSQLILAYPSMTYNPWLGKYSSLFTSAGSLKINFPQKWACYILTLQLTSCQVINVPVSNSVSCYMHFCI